MAQRFEFTDLLCGHANIDHSLNLIQNPPRLAKRTPPTGSGSEDGALGTRDRRQRELAERERLFLDKAHELICESGLLNLQMARVARASDYATGTLYQHFASKEDLLLALCSQMVGKRVELFERAVAWKAGSRERIFAVAVADTLFARRYPEHFRLEQYIFTEAVWHSASAHRRRQALEAGRPLGELVGSVVRDAVAAGDLDDHGYNPYELILGNWALSQGMHTLVHAEGLTEMYNIREPYARMLMQLNLLLNGMGWQPLCKPWDEAIVQQQVEKVRSEVFPELCDNAVAR